VFTFIRIYIVRMVPWGFSLGVNRPWREADHSPPSSAKVNNEWSCTSSPPYVFMAWCLVRCSLSVFDVVLN
jgi:hypothetical protein